MPLDIIEEVLRYLFPNDLLNLARTTKPFRHLLMSKSSRIFWTLALHKVDGLPECPSFLSEPAYTNLCFQPVCHDCFRGNTRDIWWAFGTRYCKQCSEITLVTDRKPIFVRDYPFIADPRYHFVLLYSVKDRSGEFGIFHESELDSAKAILNRLNDEQLATWLKKQERLHDEMHTWAMACAGWQHRCKKNRTKEIANAQDARLSAIIVKLQELGWGETLRWVIPREGERHMLLSLKPFRQARPLAEKAWLCIKDDIIREMQRIKASLRQIPVQGGLKTLRDAAELSVDNYGTQCPHLRDIASLPEVQTIIEALKPDDETTIQPFQSLEGGISRLVEQSKQKQRMRTLEAIKRLTGLELPGDINVLDLAITAALACKKCKKLCSDYSGASGNDILNHSCFSVAVPDEDDIDPLEMDYETLVTAFYIENLDPAATTADTMNKKPIRLFCRSSSCTSNGAHAIFSWRAAIKHFDDYNHCLEGKLDLNLAVATPEETEQIAPLEADYLKPVQSQPNLLYYCAHCPEKLWSGDKPLIKKHLQDSHDIKSLSACDVILHGSAICPTRVFWLIDYKAAAKSNREVRRMLSCNPRSSRKGQVWATVGVLNAS